MIKGRSLYHTFQRVRTLQTGKITALPIAILMPHSACNCRCAMCDIWKDNKNLKQLTGADITGLLATFKKLGTRQVLMSGGEALLNPGFFHLCEILKKRGVSVTLLSTGLTVKKHASAILDLVDNLIVSLDGDEATHDMIRNIPNAFARLREGVEHLKTINPGYQITARTVIQRMNFYGWESIIAAAKNMGLNQISFLPADVSSHAFNRQTAWAEPRQHQILPSESELPAMQEIIERIINNYPQYFATRFIAEGPDKLRNIHHYYAAFYGHNPFPFKKCNAPWVSTVIEADGSVRPCFFMDAIGNIHDAALDDILNNNEALSFRRTLDVQTNPTCVKCVCHLHLSPRVNPGVL